MPKLVSPAAGDDVRADLRAQAARQDPSCVAEALRALRDRPDRTGDLARIAVPTLVVVGEDDGVTPPAAARALHDGIDGSRLETIPGAGHLSAAERPDEFASLVAEFAEGIGPAYRAGFGVALGQGADRVVEMDCDFSHDPESLPRLVAATRDADLALGSRYVPGGGVTRWGLVRRLISRGGGLYAKFVLGIPVEDLTGGFKCFRRAVLEAVPLDEVDAAGYGFQVEMTYRAWLAGFRIVEVPITFSERERGSSKMSRRIVLEAATLVPRLRWRLGRGRRGGAVGRA